VKNILMISYFAPPLNLPPAIRIGKFAKYLPQFGWNPIILTVKEIDFYQEDKELYKDIPDLKMIRTETFDFFRILRVFQKNRKTEISKKLHQSNEKLTNFIKSIFPIDDKIGWMPFCYHAAQKIIKTYPIDAIYVSLGGIFHTAITGYLLTKKYNIPLFLEFRDLWADHPFLTQRFFNKILNNYWERKITGFAQKIIVVTPGMKEYLLKKYKMKENRIEVITNGFDESDFKFPAAPKNDKSNMIFTFCGSFYKDLSPLDLYRSLMKIDNKNQKIIIRFIGEFRNYFYVLKEKYEKKLNDKNIMIEVIPRLKYHRLLQKLSESDLLLVFLPEDEKYKLILTAKVFDYLALKIPILGFCPEESEQERFIKIFNLGFSVQSGNISQGKNVINNILCIYLNDELKNIHGVDNSIRQFSRKKLSEKFAEVLNPEK